MSAEGNTAGEGISAYDASAMLLEEVTERVNGLQFVNSDTSEPSLLPTSCDYLDGVFPVTSTFYSFSWFYLRTELSDLSEYFEIEVEKLTTTPPTRPYDYDNAPDLGTALFRVKLRIPIAWKKAGESEVRGHFGLAMLVAVARTFSTEDTNSNSTNSNGNSSSIDSLTSYTVNDFEISQRPEWMVCEFEAAIETIFRKLIAIRSEKHSMPISSILEDFYQAIEEYNYPDKSIIERDYYYPVFDPRHWGRHLNLSFAHAASSYTTFPGSVGAANLNVSYRARAMYDFQALMQGELSFQENEVLQVLANLGNGWLTARKVHDSRGGSPSSEDALTGLIPENYIERIP